jgi:P-type Cu+ transporter
MAGLAARTLDFSFLDKPEFRERYASGPARDRMCFYIEGINCGKCVRKLEDLALDTPGLRSLRVEMGKNLAHAQVDTGSLAFSALAQKIESLGFRAIPLEREEEAVSAERAEDKKQLIRLGVGAACAGNIMTFSFALYFGAGEELKPLLSWLSFALYLPVLTYVALPFYRGALASLRARQISIDLPMAIASLAGFAFSTVHLLRGKDDFYFDSLSGFLFLILLSRWVQRRIQRGFLRPQELLETLNLKRVRKLDEHGWSWKPLDSLIPGDRILIHAPETLPCEAELVSTRAHFSMAWLSGESRPKTFLRGASIPAGARLLSGEIQVIVRKTLGDTGFGGILNEIRRFSLSKNAMVSMSDRWAQRLLAIVFTAAAAFLVLYWPVSPEEAIRRSLALIILACPCAMAFGTPLALASALKRAQKAGLIVRSANVFEKITQVGTIFLDKTGTLTETDLKLRESPSSVPLVYQKIVLSLENESLHPIAFAFRAAFRQAESFPPSEGAREVAGVGVSAFIYGKFYELKRGSNVGSVSECTLFEDHQPLFRFTFEAAVKPGTVEAVHGLRARGKKLILLSGDKKETVESLGRELGFGPGEIEAETDPCAKAAIVASAPGSMMIGDGINDSLAMIRAGVGVAVSGGMEAALKSSSVFMTEPNLKSLNQLFDISAGALTLIRRNLVVSVVYNSIGGTLALMGFVNPLVAALLMPLSSAFILLSTWLADRKPV